MRFRSIVGLMVFIVSVGAALAVVIAAYAPIPPQSPKMQSTGATPRAASQPSVPLPSAPPVDPLQPVAEFHPVTMKLYQVTGQGEHDFVPQTPMDTGQLDVDGDGNVVHQDSSGSYLGPREAPGVVVHPSRAWPGKDTGTTEVDCHAEVYPKMVCTPLMDLPEGTGVYGDGSYRVDLAGPSGQLVTYAINEVVRLDKGDITTRPEFNKNDVNRLLIYTCQVDSGQRIVADRIVVATLVASKAAGS